MKKTETHETTVCDFCEVKSTYYKCRRCGKDTCKECGTQMVTQVYFNYSGDPTYCHACYKILLKQGDDPLFCALQKVSRLYHELMGWDRDFKERRERAEQEAERLNKSQVYREAI